MTHRWLSVIGAINGALVVILGAVGAHMLDAPERAPLLQTAVLYHMFHTLALLFIGHSGAAYPRSILWWWSGGSMLVGIVLFCGSLYAAALIGYRDVTSLAPIGGHRVYRRLGVACSGMVAFALTRIVSIHSIFLRFV